jgi:hypothetical protein
MGSKDTPHSAKAMAAEKKTLESTHARNDEPAAATEPINQVSDELSFRFRNQLRTCSSCNHLAGNRLQFDEMSAISFQCSVK